MGGLCSKVPYCRHMLWCRHMPSTAVHSQEHRDRTGNCLVRSHTSAPRSPSTLEPYTPSPMLSLQVTEGLGCAESWNHITAIAPRAPWVIVTAYDVAFLPGQLAKLAQHYEADLQVRMCITRGPRSALTALG